jgi:hypothetical protein
MTTFSMRISGISIDFKSWYGIYIDLLDCGTWLDHTRTGGLLPAVDAALAELLRTDRLLRSASLSDRQALEELLWSIRPERRAA